MQKLAVIIPAYNEALNIETTLNDIEKFKHTLSCEVFTLVINDASTDFTSENARKSANQVIDLSINLGIGGAVQTGILFAKKHHFDYALQFDGDGQHNAEDISALFNKMIQENLDVVIGSRFLQAKGDQSTLSRRVGIVIISKLLQIVTGSRFSDPTSGFRLMNKKAIEVIADIYPDEYPEPEAIVIFKNKNLKIGEVSVKMNARKYGKSSINNLLSAYYMMKVCLAIVFSRLKTRN
jgi:glycosyltransferase involved in cell wall biosynthesis